LAIFDQFELKTNKSELYRIQINDVVLGLGTHSQIARHCLCGPNSPVMCPVTLAYLHRPSCIKLF